MPLAALDAAAIDERIVDAEEDIALAQTDVEMTRATEALDHLKRLRAAL